VSPPPPRLTTSRGGQRRRALVVDANADSRRQYTSDLESRGFHVEQAWDGRVALARAIAFAPHVIVMDVDLPGMNGFDLCVLLRDDRATQRSRIIVVAAHPTDSDITRALAVGAQTVLNKPCSGEQLRAATCGMLLLPRSLKRDATAVKAAAPTWTDERRNGHPILDPALDMVERRHGPPDLACPVCDIRLTHLRTHVGGVSRRHPEQWDDFKCHSCQGAFQYRTRTRKLRRVD